MKKIELIIILFLINLPYIISQNYQAVKTDRIAYFNNQYGNVKCIRIDSVSFQSDSIFYPFSNIQSIDYDCYTPYGASWIGNKLIIKNNSYNIFFNKKQDTIKIKTNALLNESWTVYELTDSIKIIAEVLKHDTIGFLGQLDSVKTIGFQAYDKNMNKLDLDINEMQLQISKTYGFVKVFNLYLFPYPQVDYSGERFEEYDLIGLSNPKVGVNNLTWFEVNDFQVGDELHVMDKSSCVAGYGYGSIITNKAIYKYLERMDYSDSIVYRYSRRQSIFTNWLDSSDFKYYNDTLKTTIKPDSLFDMLPDEPIVTDYGTYNYYMTNESPLSKTNPRSYKTFAFSNDSCWRMIISDGCLRDDKYIKGLGGPYYSCAHYFCLGEEERKLVYYKKGDITWGSPLIVTDLSDISITKNITIYPNPAKNHISITFANSNYQNLQIFVYNVQGELQEAKSLESNNSLIDISHLNPGIYIIKIADNTKVLKMNRLIIE